MEEALKRAAAYTEAGVSGIMIHSKQKKPDEILEFILKYRALDVAGASTLPIVVVPTSYNSITEVELCEAGVSVCIYANQLLRGAYPAMLGIAESILTNHRSK